MFWWQRRKRLAFAPASSTSPSVSAMALLAVLLLSAWLGTAAGRRPGPPTLPPARDPAAPAVKPSAKPLHSSPVSARAAVPLDPKPAAWKPPPLPFALGETSGILWDLNTHQLLWELHPHQVGPLASTTKLMTAYLVLHRGPALGQTVTIGPNAAGTAGSDIKMAVGYQFTVEQLLYALMLASANDAAVALAEQSAGSTAAFVRQMNQTAQNMGLKGFHFADPDGLSRQSVGTAWDLSVIAMRDWQSPLFRRIVATKHVALPHNPQVWNLNQLLYVDPSVIGIKTGWTTPAGFNLVFAVQRPVHGHPVTLLGVLLHGQHGFSQEDQDAERLINWEFARLNAQPGPTPAGSQS